jgi:hypothetical protein
MPGTRAISSALAVAACAAALAACGGDDEGGPIPTDQGNQLLGLLDQVESLVNAGDCTAAQDAAVEFGSQVNELPPEVDGELRNSLVSASSSLTTLTEEQCEDAPTGPSGEEGVVTPEPDPEEPAPTEPETDPPTEEPPPEDEDEGDDEGEGGGPPADTPGNGNPGGGNGSGSGEDGGGSSGGIGSDG